MNPGQNQFLLYTAPHGAVKVDVFLKDETLWLTQKALAELFGVKRPAITKHLLNIFSSGELAEDSVCSILEHTAGDGKTYSAKYYNLDAIIAVGYRVNSYQATQFRIWATKTLREFIIKGFVMDDERLKRGKLAAVEAELKSRLDVHEVAIVEVLQRLMKILDPPPPPPEPPAPQIGFHVKEDAVPYRVKRKTAHTGAAKGGAT